MPNPDDVTAWSTPKLRRSVRNSERSIASLQRCVCYDDGHPTIVQLRGWQDEAIAEIARRKQ